MLSECMCVLFFLFKPVAISFVYTYVSLTQPSRVSTATVYRLLATVAAAVIQLLQSTSYCGCSYGVLVQLSSGLILCTKWSKKETC